MEIPVLEAKGDLEAAWNSKRNIDEAKPCRPFLRAICEYAKYLSIVRFDSFKYPFQIEGST